MDSGSGLGMLQTCGVSIPGAKLERNWDIGQKFRFTLKNRLLTLPARSAPLTCSVSDSDESAYREVDTLT